jgi:hypothetical protein
MSDQPKTTKPERDARGRFLGCGNLKGRPEKVNLIGVDASPYVFANSKLDLNLNGENVTMTRQEALLNRLYQKAMKGDTRAIIYLDNKFDEANETFENARFDLRDLMEKWRNAPEMSEEKEIRGQELNRITRALLTLQRLVNIKDNEQLRKKKRRG